MIDTIIFLLACYGMTFFIKESDILARPRSWLMMKSVFITKMLYCWFCTGFWASILVCLLRERNPNIDLLFLCGLAGATFSLFMNAIYNKLTYFKDS
jgi:Protein of unknown function (DUF1360)